MTRHDRASRLFAACLSLLAGYVDAVGFMALGGFFVSFMSGNSTRFSVGLTRGSGEAGLAGALIAGFVAGVVLGALLSPLAGHRRPAAVLALVAGLLASAAVLARLGAGPWALVAAAMAMGAENNVFQREGEVSIGVTYMTGTLVKLGQKLAGAVQGGDPWAWTHYLLLWLGLVAGAVLGASVYPRLGLNALWIAAATALLLAGGSGAVFKPAADRPS
jgi:uncharacterized membrane protein YoaK (UPF0700 family)